MFLETNSVICCMNECTQWPKSQTINLGPRALSFGFQTEVVIFIGRHRNRGKLSDLVAEHLDHLHYLNDILIINCEFLNDVLTDHLLNRLFLPLYVYSLENQDKVSLGARPHCSCGLKVFRRRERQSPWIGLSFARGHSFEPARDSFQSTLVFFSFPLISWK